jgi:hypothetical protein
MKTQAIQAEALVPINANALLILSALFTASLVTANLLGSRLVQLGSVTVSVGLFVFPFTFIVADIATEAFGKDIASRLVKTGIVVQLYVLFFIQLGAWLPGSPVRDLTRAYSQMFALAPRMVLASISAYTVSQLLDVKVFSYLRRIMQGRLLLVRTNLSLWLSQAIDTLIFSAIFLGGVLSMRELLKTALVSYASKLVLGTIDSPFVSLGVWALRRYSERS